MKVIKEELNAKMHSEFKVSFETEYLHRLETAVEMANIGVPLLRASEIFDVNARDLESHPYYLSKT